MKGWKECPDCWGTGLVGGFTVPCRRQRDSYVSAEDVQRWLAEELENPQSVPQAVVRTIARALVRDALGRVLEGLPHDHGEARGDW